MATTSPSHSEGPVRTVVESVTAGRSNIRVGQHGPAEGAGGLGQDVHPEIRAP